MNLITDTWRGLVQRKLWPVALLLVAALVAVPLKLAKTPEPATPAANAATTQEEGLPATYVSAADATVEDSDTTKRRRTLGESKDPFEPAPLPKKKKSKKKATAETAAASEPTDTTTSGGGSTPAPSEPPVSVAPRPAPTYPLYSIKVKFGQVDGDLTTRTVERLRVLPSADAPVLVYRGVEEGGKIAVFELTGSVVALGDGKCEPTPEDCQILKLKVGETEFLTVSDTGDEATDAQYQLELKKINTKATTQKSELAKASSAGRELLSALSADRKTRYVFDEETGALHKVTSKSASKLTRAARRASL